MSFFRRVMSLFGFKSKGPQLAPGDRMLVCEDCRNEFVFDVGEQKFFKSKGFTDPKRCPTCRKKIRSKSNRRGGRFFRKKKNSNGGDNNPPSRHGGRRSVIDGRSPYADDR